MNIVIAIMLSIAGQFIMTVVFAKEMLTTSLGTYCRVKCALAAVLYLFFAILLSWMLFSKFIHFYP